MGLIQKVSIWILIARFPIAGVSSWTSGIVLPLWDNCLSPDIWTHCGKGRPKVFKTQLRALFRVSMFGNISIMYPMIISVTKVKRLRLLWREWRKILQKREFLLKLRWNRGWWSRLLVICWPRKWISLVSVPMTWHSIHLPLIARLPRLTIFIILIMKLCSAWFRWSWISSIRKVYGWISVSVVSPDLLLFTGLYPLISTNKRGCSYWLCLGSAVAALPDWGIFMLVSLMQQQRPLRISSGCSKGNVTGCDVKYCFLLEASL